MEGKGSENARFDVVREVGRVVEELAQERVCDPHPHGLVPREGLGKKRLVEDAPV